MFNRLIAFCFSVVLAINSTFVVASPVWDTLDEWGHIIKRSYDNAVGNLLDHIAGHDYNILSPSNNNILSPSANYFTTTTNSNNSTLVHNQQTYNNTTNYVYSGDTNYTNYYLTSNQYDNRSYYTIDNSNNYYSTDTYYFYEDTNNYYTSYYEYTNYTVISIPKTNPNTITSYKIYYQTPLGQNSYNLTPSDVYGVYMNGDIYNYNAVVDGDVLALWSLDGNRVNEVPDSEFELYYDGQTYVNAKFGSGLQTNGETKLTILGDKLPDEYSLRFWYYNADSQITALPLNAWSCVDIVHTELNNYVWVNGIQKTFGADKFSQGIFNNGTPVYTSGSINITPSSSAPSSYIAYDTHVGSYYYYDYYQYDIIRNYYTYSYTPITMNFVPKPTFSSDSIVFVGTDSPISTGTNFGTPNDRLCVGWKSTIDTTSTLPYYSSVVPSLNNINQWSVSNTSAPYCIHKHRYSVTTQLLANLFQIQGTYWNVSNSIIDDICLYNGAQWVGGTNHINDIPTDPQEVGYIWTSPTGNFKKGDIAIKSAIEVTGYRVGGAQPTPAYRGLLYISLDDNYYATDCKIYNGSTWVHIDFGVWNGTSWISGYNFDFKNGFTFPPSDSSDEPGGDGSQVDLPVSALDSLNTIGQVLQWLGAFLLVFPIIPLSIRLFLSGILILLGTLITYKFVRRG